MEQLKILQWILLVPISGESNTPPRARNIAAAAQESIPATPGAGMTSEQSQAVSANQRFLADNPDLDPGSYEHEFIRATEPRIQRRPNVQWQGGSGDPQPQQGAEIGGSASDVGGAQRMDQETYDFLQHLKEQGLYEDNQEISDWMQEAIDDHLAGVLDEGDVYAMEPEMVVENTPPSIGGFPLRYGVALPPGARGVSPAPYQLRS